MEKIPASEKLRKQFEATINGSAEGESILDAVLRKGAAIVVQEMLEQEVTDFLGRDHYERRNRRADSKAGYRNGYEPLNIKTPEGKIRAYIPQVRDPDEPFRSKLVTFFRAHSEVLEKLTVEMYVRGLSTRDIEDALMEATGDRILSRTAVSKVTDILYEEFEAFQNRDLSQFELEYLFLDAIYERLRKDYGMKEGVLCAWGITRQGEKVLLHMELGNKESYDAWLGFLRNMVKRGLRTPITITSDGSPGVIKAIDLAFSRSLRLRCWVHRMRNFSGKVPDEFWPEVKQELIAIRDAANYNRGRQLAFEFIDRYKGTYPSLIKSFKDDLDALLNHLKVPASHRRYVRTTNLIERSFEEERRRTKVIPGFLTEKSALKLVYSVLIRTSNRWRRVKFTDTIECALDGLRKELNIKDGTSTAKGNGKESDKSEATLLQEI